MSDQVIREVNIMTAVSILVIPADTTEAVRVESIEPGLEPFQKLVGGYIEQLPGRDAPGVTGDSWLAYVNEEGKLENLAVNERATAFMHSVGGIYDWDTINGAMIIIGEGDGEEADYADIPPQLLQFAGQGMDISIPA
jgi:hypothetical protein